MKIFISGGCKNGKSYYAQHYTICNAHRLGKAQQPCPLYYIATMRPIDTEDDKRIARHRREREGWGFTTIEQPVDIEKITDTCDASGSFLLDSLTALLMNEMFLQGNRVNEYAAEKIIAGLVHITSTINNIVVVSDYIYSDAILYNPLTEKYRESLAKIDRTAAENCDIVLETAFTNIIVHKGKEIRSVYETIP